MITKKVGPFVFNIDADNYVTLSHLGEVLGNFSGKFWDWMYANNFNNNIKYYGVHVSYVEDWWAKNYATRSGWVSNPFPSEFNGKLEAIKFLRTATGCGLADGKAFVELCMKLGVKEHSPDKMVIDGKTYHRTY